MSSITICSAQSAVKTDTLTVPKMQLDSVLVDSLTADSIAVDSMMVDSLMAQTKALSDSLANMQQSKQKKIFYYNPWHIALFQNQERVLTDSLYRWDYSPFIMDVFDNDAKIIAARSGIQNRSETFFNGTDGPFQLKLDWNGMPMQHPNGMRQLWNYLPAKKLQQIVYTNEGSQHRYSFSDRVYQLNEPWSYLNYEESGNDFRNLEFLVSRNFSKRSNLELSFEQRKDGNLYVYNGSELNAMYARFSYQLSKKWQMHHRFMRNDLSMEESFGYNVVDPFIFGFNPYSSAPQQSGAERTQYFGFYTMNFQYRPDSTAATQADLSFFRQKFNDKLDYKDDNESVLFQNNTTNYGVNAEYQSNLFDVLEYKMASSFELNKVDIDTVNLSGIGIPRSYALGNSQLTLQKGLLSNYLQLFTTAALDYQNHRNKWEQASHYSLGITSKKWVDLSVIVSAGDHLTSTWQYDWNKGNVPQKTSYASAEVNITVPITSTIKSNFFVKQRVGDDFRYRTNRKDPFSAYAKIVFDNEHWEITPSVHYLKENLSNVINEQIKVAGGVYHKGYIFKRAAYLKIGLEGAMQLKSYYGLAYNTVGDYWEYDLNSHVIPSWAAADLVVNARIRSMIFNIRWENIFDQMNQLGYFEIPNYPMPYKRLIFSVKAVFKN